MLFPDRLGPSRLPRLREREVRFLRRPVHDGVVLRPGQRPLASVHSALSEICGDRQWPGIFLSFRWRTRAMSGW
jgi:hypothetical protein